MIDTANIRARLEQIEERIGEAARRSGHDPQTVRLLVASKYYEPDQVASLAEAGVRLLGENRSDQLAEKQEAFPGAFDWHFIGHLQRRKAKEVVGRVSLIHSVDSGRLIEELEKRAAESEAIVDVLLQVNVSGEESKYGVVEKELEPLLERTLERADQSSGRVRVRGLMTIAPLVEEPEDVRYVFAKLKVIRDRLTERWWPDLDLPELSMGMSSDYAIAVEEGATIVRIGRAIIDEGGISGP